MDDADTTADDPGVPDREGPGAPTTARFTTDGSAIVEAGLGGTGQTGRGEILTPSTLRVIAAFSAPPGYKYLGAAASRDDRAVAAVAYRDVDGAFADGLVQTFDLHTGEAPGDDQAPSRGHPGFRSKPDESGERLVTVYGDGMRSSGIHAPAPPPAAAPPQREGGWGRCIRRTVRRLRPPTIRRSRRTSSRRRRSAT